MVQKCNVDGAHCDGDDAMTMVQWFDDDKAPSLLQNRAMDYFAHALFARKERQSYFVVFVCYDLPITYH